MQHVQSQVQHVANAFRETMAEGDRRLAGSFIERKILQAVVADTACSVEHWVKTRVPDGEDVAKPLTGLAKDLNQGNPVGHGLAAAQSELFKQAKSAVLGFIFGGAWPIWAGTVVAFFAAIFANAQSAGVALGKALIPTLLGGGAAAVVIFRGLGMLGSAAKGTGEAAGSLWDSAGRIGSQAEAIAEKGAGPALADLKPSGYGGGVSRSVITKLRGSSQVTLGISYALFIVVILFFIYGVWQAWDAYYQACYGTGIPSTNCPGG
jgi:hypothetical protein